MATESCGYYCEFVDGPPKELHSECSICLMVLREPYLVDCCGHHFCKACLEGATNENKICPLCKQTSFTAIPNKGLERVLKEKEVFCTNKKAGCEWSGELRQLDSHLVPSLSSSALLDGCQYVEVGCAYSCPVSLTRNEMKEHLDVCPNRLMLCQYCKNHSAPQYDLEEKHVPVCPKFPLSCPNNCGASIQRKNITRHVDTICPLSTLSCEYSHVGCAVLLTRRDMEMHLKGTAGLKEHLSLMDNAYSGLRKSQNESKQKEDKLIKRVQSLENELGFMKERLAHQVEEFGPHKKASLENEIRHLKSVVRTLEVENKSLKANQAKAQVASASTCSVMVPVAPAIAIRPAKPHGPHHGHKTEKRPPPKSTGHHDTHSHKKPPGSHDKGTAKPSGGPAKTLAKKATHTPSPKSSGDGKKAASGSAKQAVVPHSGRPQGKSLTLEYHTRVTETSYTVKMDSAGGSKKAAMQTIKSYSAEMHKKGGGKKK